MLSKGPNRVGVLSLRLRMEADPVPEMPCLLVFRIPDDGRSSNPSNSERYIPLREPLRICLNCVWLVSIPSNKKQFDSLCFNVLYSSIDRTSPGTETQVNMRQDSRKQSSISIQTYMKVLEKTHTYQFQPKPNSK
jgi:hypothetical protein